MTNQETKEPTVRDMTPEEEASLERVSEPHESVALEREANDIADRAMVEYLRQHPSLAGSTATLETLRHRAKQAYLKSRKEDALSPTIEDIVSRLELTEDVATHQEKAPAVFSEEEHQYIQKQLAQAFGEQWPADELERKQLVGPVVQYLAHRVVEWSEGSWESLDREVREATISAALQQWLGKQLNGRRS